jgi:hypothetical protein
MAPNTKKGSHTLHAATRPRSGRTSVEKARSSRTTFSRPFKDQSDAWRNGPSFGLHDLRGLMNVALEAKEWIAALWDCM